MSALPYTPPLPARAIREQVEGRRARKLAEAERDALAQQIEQREPVANPLFARTVGVMTHDGRATEAGQTIRVYVFKQDTDRIDLQICHGQLGVATHVSGAMARALAAELIAAADAMDAAAAGERA